MVSRMGWWIVAASWDEDDCVEYEDRERQRERRRLCACGRERVVRIGPMSDSRRIIMVKVRLFGRSDL